MPFTSPTDPFTLANDVPIPCLGFGTWQAPDGEQTVAAVRAAIAAGYRHIDTAAFYGNEASVGAAVRTCGVPRDQLFITSKLWNDAHGYRETLDAFDQSMARLGLDTLDLYLIHWPNPACFRDCWREKNAGTWRAFEELYRAGRVRAIGVSNFRPHHLEALLETAQIAPMVNQLLLCPGTLQQETTDWCRARGIVLEAYSPLGAGSLLRQPTLLDLADKYRRSPAQLCIRWCLQRGFLPLPKSLHAARIQDNAAVFDFTIAGEDMAVLDAVTGGKAAKDPDTVDF